jgi:hypothetical protein
VAEVRSLIESWGVLSGWDTGSSCVGFCFTLTGEGPFDWIGNRIMCTSFSACSQDNFHQLARVWF